VVAAAGNEASVGGSCITQHPWVIPVISCDCSGMPVLQSNLSASIGRNGLRAPGQDITSLGPAGKNGSFSGTSVACPFVTGAIALLWSEYPKLRASDIKDGLTRQPGRNSVVPPLMNASGAFLKLRTLAPRTCVA
jgi:subtilisin family serine protease